ncbi:hypothetical protein RhiirA1_400713, partial [Rhizophagus irregularis]
CTRRLCLLGFFRTVFSANTEDIKEQGMGGWLEVWVVRKGRPQTRRNEATKFLKGATTYHLIFDTLEDQRDLHYDDEKVLIVHDQTYNLIFDALEDQRDLHYDDEIVHDQTYHCPPLPVTACHCKKN